MAPGPEPDTEEMSRIALVFMKVQRNKKHMLRWSVYYYLYDIRNTLRCEDGHARVSGCACVCIVFYASRKGQREAKAFQSCSEFADQYGIVLGNKQWAFSFVNLLEQIINPGAFSSPSSLHSVHTHTRTHG